jgi:hypothetical protein
MNRSGLPTNCTINERDGRWQLIINEGHTVVLTERCASDDAALTRANQIWKVMVENGWTEPEH